MVISLENVKRGLSLVKTVNFNADYRKGPIILEIGTTTGCNHKCYFCAEHSKLIPLEHKPFRMTDEMLWKLISDIKKLKIGEIRFAGSGEPTADPRLAEIVDYLYNANVNVNIVTNGSLFHKFKDSFFSKLHKITMSINSLDDKTHQLIHSYNGSSQLQIIIDGLDRLIKIPEVKKKIQINYVMTTDNVDEFSKVLDFIETKNVFMAIRPVYVGYEEIASKKLTIEHINKILSQVEEKISRGRPSKAISKSLNHLRQSFTFKSTHKMRNKLLPCFAGFYGGYIESNGDYRISPYCDGPPMANIDKAGFLELWKTTKFQSKLYNGCVMNETGIPLYKNCNNCLEGDAYSGQFYNIFSKIPFQMQKLRKKQKNI